MMKKLLVIGGFFFFFISGIACQEMKESFLRFGAERSEVW